MREKKIQTKAPIILKMTAYFDKFACVALLLSEHLNVPSFVSQFCSKCTLIARPLQIVYLLWVWGYVAVTVSAVLRNSLNRVVYSRFTPMKCKISNFLNKKLDVLKKSIFHLKKL